MTRLYVKGEKRDQGYTYEGYEVKTQTFRPVTVEDITPEMLRQAADALFAHNVTGMALWREEVARAVLAAALGVEEETRDYDATNAVRLCARCEDECGVSAGADAGDRACSVCGQHDAPHVYARVPGVEEER